MGRLDRGAPSIPQTRNGEDYARMGGTANASPGGVHSWVYTERKNVGAMEFYADAGYQSEGLFGSTGLPQAAADDDSPLFKKTLG